MRYQTRSHRGIEIEEMNEMKHDTERRKRGLKWKPEVIDRLIRYRLLEFLPAPEITVQLHSVADTETAKSTKYPDAETVKKLDAALRPLSRRRMPMAQLREDLRHVVRVMSDQDGLLDVTRLAHVNAYVHDRLGLGRPLWSDRSASPDTDLLEARKEQARQKRQLHCVWVWMGLDGDLWSDALWKECVLLRYDQGSSCPPIDWMAAGVRRELDTLARSHSNSDLDIETARDVVRSCEGCHRYGPIRTFVACQYLIAKATRNKNLEAFLGQPVDESGFFKLVTDGSRAGSEALGQIPFHSPHHEKWKYLARGVNTWDELLGQVVYYLIRLSNEYGDPLLAPLPPGLAAIWPDETQLDHGRALARFGALADRYTDALGIDRRVFTDIWVAHRILFLREARRRRGPATLTVFWVARILEELRPDVYNAYRHWIDHFYKLVSDTTIESERDGKWRWAALNPFISAMLSDPLLNAVFHTEVLDGRDLAAIRPGVLTGDDRITNLTLAYAERRLRDVWPTRVEIRINDLLREVPETSQKTIKVLDAYADSPEAVDVGPRSLYAYLAALALPMLGESPETLTPYKVKWRCLEHRDSAEIDALLTGLEHQFTASTQWDRVL